MDDKAPDPPPAKQHRRPLGKRLLLASVSGLIAIAAIELVLVLVGFRYQLYPEKIEFGAPTPEQIDSGFLADRDLLWVTKDYFEKLSAARGQRPDVVFMGDSCTDWGNYERYFDGLIQQNFPNKKYRYASLAVAAWASYQGLRQLERDVLPLKPSVITVYFGWNDHWKGFGIQDKDVAWVNSSMLFQLQKYSRIAQLVTKAYIGMTRDPKAPLLRVSPEDFRSNLTEMARLAKTHRITLVLITAPTSHELGKEPEYLKLRHVDDLKTLIPMHQQYVSIVRDVAQREGVILCDLAKVFEGFPAERRHKALFQADGIHLQDEGDQVIAVELYHCFEQNGLMNRILR